MKKSKYEVLNIREILKKSVLNISVEGLIQMTKFELSGCVANFNGCIGMSGFFNKIEYIEAENEDETDLISFMYIEGEDVISSTEFSIDSIEEISGSLDMEDPDNLLDIIMHLEDGTEVDVTIAY